MFPRRRYRIAIVGATGAVGAELLKELDARRFPTSELRALCSPASAGSKVSWGKTSLVATAAVAEQFQGLDLVLSAAGAAAAAEWLPLAQAAGAVCIDCSDWSRQQPGVPLVVPEVNPEALAHQQGLIASPNATAITTAVAIKPLQRLGGGLRELVLTSLEPASGAGKQGLSELSGQTVALLNFQPVDVEVHPARLAFNCIPAVGTMEDEGHTSTEQAVRSDLDRLLGIRAHVTCVRVPVFVGVGISLTCRFAETVELSDVLAALTDAPGVTLTQEQAPPYPMVMDINDQQGVKVGRVRVQGDTMQCWLVADNLRKGAATNMVQVAELLDAVWTAAQA